MKRREFIISASLLAVATQVRGDNTICSEKNTPEITSFSQGYFEIRHQHEFKIPLEILINPPATGYSARSSSPLKGQTDFEGLRNRTDANGAPLDLRGHAHTVQLTEEQLNQLSQGRHVTIDLEKFGHRFYFVANDITLKEIQNRRGIK